MVRLSLHMFFPSPTLLQYWNKVQKSSTVLRIPKTVFSQWPPPQITQWVMQAGQIFHNPLHICYSCNLDPGHMTVELPHTLQVLSSQEIMPAQFKDHDLWPNILEDVYGI